MGLVKLVQERVGVILLMVRVKFWVTFGLKPLPAVMVKG